MNIGDRVKVIDKNITGEIIEDYGSYIVIIDDDSEYESPDDTLEFRKSDVELLLACDYSINRDFQKKEKEQ